MNLLDLYVKLTVDDQASADVKSASSDMKSSLSGVAGSAEAFTAAMAATVAAVAALTAAFVTGVKSVAEYGDHVDKMSQKMGISAEAYQEWDAVLQHCGSSIDSMKMGMKTLANAAETGNDAFEKLGITQSQIASMNQEQLFEATIAALQQVEDETERTYLAGQLLGRGAMELGPLLNTSAEDTQKMRDRVHELGGVLSDDAVKAAARFQDELQDMQTAFDGVKNKVLADFLPAISDAFRFISDVMTSNEEQFVAFREAMKVAVPIVVALTAGMMAYGAAMKIATIVEAARTALVAFKAAQEASTVAQAALNAVMSANPFVLIATVIAAVITALITLYATNKDFRNFVNGAWKEIGKVVGGVADTIAKFFESLAKRVDSWVKTFKYIVSHLPEIVQGFVQDMAEAGANLIDGLIDGIKSGMKDVVDTIKDGLKKAVNEALKFLGIASPSKLFKWVGEMSMEGLSIGLSDNVPDIAGLLDGISMDPMSVGMKLYGVGPSPAAAYGDTYNITVNASGDGQAVARAIVDELHAFNLVHGRR